jgi:hypothetical protein
MSKPTIREGGKATIIQHCAVFGTVKTQVRMWSVGEPKPYAQYPVAVYVGFCKPRLQQMVVHHRDAGRFLTVESGGEVLYDSRADVPIDMEAWKARYRKERAEWLERQAEIDAHKAKTLGVSHSQQMGDFSVDVPEAALARRSANVERRRRIRERRQGGG